jgi:hypothetical protein
MGEDNPKVAPEADGTKLLKKELAARTKTDFTGWRKRIQASKLKFDDTQKSIYLNVLAKTGRKNQAAQAAGVCTTQVLRHRDNDPDFELAFQEAMGKYHDKVHTLAYKLMDGIKEPIVGGKDKDQIVAYKLVHATNLLAMEMRRVNPEYKERAEVEHTGGGGVLLAPAGISPQDFAKAEEERNKNKTEPGVEEGK